MSHSFARFFRGCAAWATAVAVGLALLAPAGANASARSEPDLSQGLSVSRAYQDAKDAPPSKYIKKVNETRTTANLNLRSKASTSSKSFGVIPAGTAVELTGNKSGTWAQIIWQGKSGWASLKYLKTATYTKNTSVRYIKADTRMYTKPSFGSSAGLVQFRSKVALLDIKGSWSQNKT